MITTFSMRFFIGRRPRGARANFVHRRGAEGAEEQGNFSGWISPARQLYLFILLPLLFLRVLRASAVNLLSPFRPGANVAPMSQPDKFEEIFRLQAILNKRIGVNLDDLAEEEKAKWVLNYTRAMSQEMAELIDSVPWKWWAKYQKFDEQNARVEVIDLFHFLVSIAQTLGMTADDVFQAYVKKNEVNHQRQESGYTRKDEDDSRHI
jgi:dimeric dUTPase (all-alpha-NTP-PPase superfamily)